MLLVVTDVSTTSVEDILTSTRQSQPTTVLLTPTRKIKQQQTEEGQPTSSNYDVYDVAWEREGA